MATPLSAQHARNNIRLHWEHAGFQALQFALSEAVEKELGAHPIGTRLGALYVFVDEYIGLLRYAAYYFLSGVKKSDSTAAVFYQLAIKQIRNLCAIRVLCSAGLDGNARMQLRLLYETSLLWVRALVDPQIRDEFKTSVTPAEANTFWHKHLSKEKNDRWLKAHLSARGIFWLGGDNDMASEMKEKMSLSAHPTWLQAAYDAQDDWNNPDDDGLVLARPSVASHFTLSMALYATAIPFSLMPEPSYGIETTDLSKSAPWPPTHNSNPPWEEYNAKLRNMFPRLMIAAVRFAEELRRDNPTPPNADNQP